MDGLGKRSYCMKEKKHYEYVSRQESNEYLTRINKILKILVQKLKRIGIKSKFYIIGSAGKRNLVTRLVINGKKKPFDVDVNIEILYIPPKYEKLDSLKELIRTELNKSIKELKENFSDGSNSTSAITVPLYNSQKALIFSFDLGIVSRNKNRDLQRLIFKKDKEIYTWEVVFNSDLEDKFSYIRSESKWDYLRDEYLNIKNKYINDEFHPSYICYKMAINNVYNQLSEENTEYCPYCGQKKYIGETPCPYYNDD